MKTDFSFCTATLLVKDEPPLLSHDQPGLCTAVGQLYKQRPLLAEIAVYRQCNLMGPLYK